MLYTKKETTTEHYNQPNGELWNPVPVDRSTKHSHTHSSGNIEEDGAE